MDKKKIGIGLVALIIVALLGFHIFSVWSVYSNALGILPTLEVYPVFSIISILTHQSILENKEIEINIYSKVGDRVSARRLEKMSNSKFSLDGYGEIPGYNFPDVIFDSAYEVEVNLDCGPFGETKQCEIDKEKLKVKINCRVKEFNEVLQKDNYLCDISLSNTDESPKEFIKPVFAEENWRSSRDELILKSKKSKQELEKISFTDALLNKNKYMETSNATLVTHILSGASLMIILQSSEEIEAINSEKIKYFSNGNTSIESELESCLKRQVKPEEIFIENQDIFGEPQEKSTILKSYKQEYEKMVQESKTDKLNALYRCIGLEAHTSFLGLRDSVAECTSKINEPTYKAINMVNWSKDINADFSFVDTITFCKGNKILDLDRVKEETGIEITVENVELSEDLLDKHKFQHSFDGNVLTIEYSGSSNVSTGLALIKEAGQYKLLFLPN